MEVGRGRITPEDLASVLIDDLGEDGDLLIGFMGTRYHLRLAMLEHPLHVGHDAELRWLVAESDALRRFRDETPRDLRLRMVDRVRQWILREYLDVRPRGRGHEGDQIAALLAEFGGPPIDRWSDQTWESFTLRLLWRVCHEGVDGLPPHGEPAPSPIRHRDLLLLATGRDVDLMVNEVLIRYLRRLPRSGIRDLVAPGSRGRLPPRVHRALPRRPAGPGLAPRASGRAEGARSGRDVAAGVGRRLAPSARRRGGRTGGVHRRDPAGAPGLGGDGPPDGDERGVDGPPGAAGLARGVPGGPADPRAARDGRGRPGGPPRRGRPPGPPGGPPPPGPPTAASQRRAAGVPRLPARAGPGLGPAGAPADAEGRLGPARPRDRVLRQHGAAAGLPLRLRAPLPEPDARRPARPARDRRGRGRPRLVAELPGRLLHRRARGVVPPPPRGDRAELRDLRRRRVLRGRDVLPGGRRGPLPAALPDQHQAEALRPGGAAPLARGRQPAPGGGPPPPRAADARDARADPILRRRPADRDGRVAGDRPAPDAGPPAPADGEAPAALRPVRDAAA